ncbi:MAG TPA: prephenate dehydratase domain-containing protein [Acidobacteriota bacterium]|nr:prephenate dehydratase domain-containing protein [Acidobacteriota bacterium]
MDELQALRQRIDEADRDLIEALARRMEVVDHILRQKEAQGLELFDLEREKSLLNKMADHGGQRRLDPKLVERVLRAVISHSRELQTRRVQERHNPDLRRVARVAFQGAPGAYSWQALHNHFGKKVEAVGFTGFRETLEALEEGRVDLALLPIENTLFGSIHDVYELLADSRYSVIGEEVLRIEHCLLGLREVPLEEIARVLSHPVALEQCKTFLRGLPNAANESYIDTAEAVRKVREDEDPRQAAIASRQAARRYGLQVLREGISDHPENYTRFWVVSRQSVSVDKRIPAKTSLVLVTDHREGALVACLTALRDHGLNMTKLESRPRQGSPWQYQFYLDVEGNIDDEETSRALDEVRKRARLLRVLGCYPKVDARSGVPYLSESRDADSRRRALRRSSGRKSPQPSSPREAAVVAVGAVEIGGGSFAVLAGPRSFSSPGELRPVAEAAEAAGARVLLGGEYLAAQGDHGLDLVTQGAQILSRLGRELRMPVGCEVEAAEQVEALAHCCDLLIVGGRNMQNYPLLRLLGRLAKPVLLERGINSTLDELTASAQEILAEGNQHVLLCERGIRTFEASNRETLDLGAVLALKERTHLPVIVNPMGAVSTPQDVLPLARAARAVGADGVVLNLGPDSQQRPVVEPADLAEFIAQEGVLG